MLLFSVACDLCDPPRGGGAYVPERPRDVKRVWCPTPGIVGVATNRIAVPDPSWAKHVFIPHEFLYEMYVVDTDATQWTRLIVDDAETDILYQTFSVKPTGKYMPFPK